MLHLKQQIKSVFFDLDHTLWDLEKNAEETLAEIFDYYSFNHLTDAQPQDFILSFKKHNTLLWSKYSRGEISKAYLRETRFNLAMTDIQIPENKRPDKMWAVFLNKCPEKTNLMPNAIETLEYLASKYPLFLITNGFVETQNRKLKNSGIDSYFKGIIISENTGYQKPMKEIYDIAVNLANTAHHESVMIGDNLIADVEGAINAGLHSFFYNPEKNKALKPEKAIEISNLIELTSKL